MLSHPTSAIETRRRAHRRQNSTPNIEVGQLTRKNPATTGIQRANSHRGHRRGLSLDQHQSFQRPSQLTPTLGPITQDDLSVSTNITNAGHLQYRSTAVAHPGLAQPGHQNHFHSHSHSQSLHDIPLSLQTQGFPLESHSQFDQQSPHHSFPNPYNSQPHSPIGPSAPPPSGPPTQQQLVDLENHIKSVYGGYGDVYINVLPTPVATPQKRASIAPLDNVDVSPIPFTFDPSEVHLDPSIVNQDFKLNHESPGSERGYGSSFYNSPSHSNSCSPHQPSVKSFVNDLSSSQFSINENDIYSSQTTLADVEPLLPTSGSSSPNRSVSIADLRLDGTVEDTGISAEEVQQYISQQDPVNHRWTCLYPGCQSKTFGRRENIRSHVQTHLGDRQYRCNHCNKCFVRQHDLKRHAKIHSGSKPYRCPCGGGFARQDALTRHRQRGMCIGGFPNAVRKQARRGRPRKNRPDMEERLEKAARARDRAYSTDSSNAGSGAEDSPSPPAMPDIAIIDTAKLVDLPEEDELDSFSMNPSGFATHSSPHSHESYSSPFDLDEPNTTNLYDLSTEPFAETPPASPCGEVDLSNMANSPHDSITSPGLPCTPPPGSSSAPASNSSSLGGYHTTPPTSPLCAMSPPSMADACSSSTIFDDLGISAEPTSSAGASGSDAITMGMNMGAMGISFAGHDSTLATFSGLEYLKSEHDMCNMTFHEPDDDSFQMWVMEGADV